MFYVEPYFRVSFLKEIHSSGAYNPTRSQKLKSKIMRLRNKKRSKR